MQTKPTTLKVIIMLCIALVVLLRGKGTLYADENQANVSSNSNPEITWFRRVFCQLDWAEVSAIVESPSGISSQIRHHVEYREDLNDEWTKGSSTWQRGYGDCEDFALAVKELCKLININVRILVFYPKGNQEAHAVAIGKWKGKMWISSNGWHQTVKSLEHAKQEIAKQMGWRRKTILTKNLSELTGATEDYAIGKE
ncbi:MAG: hypothetical protein KAH23_01580 [Kiritimatiellae bacterium]|nr:hypothetical protein [Kiritimatiellia bacterium]